jgi:hypothetical protein
VQELRDYNASSTISITSATSIGNTSAASTTSAFGWGDAAIMYFGAEVMNRASSVLRTGVIPLLPRAYWELVSDNLEVDDAGICFRQIGA